MKAYSLGSPFGKVPCESLVKSHNKEPFASFSGDPIAVWGQLRGAKDLLAKSRHFYRLDHAYVGRLDYYRMTRNAFQPVKLRPRPADRWEQLKARYKLKVGEWRKGKHILITLSDPRTYEFFGVKDWPQEIEAKVKSLTDRPIILRKREERIPIAEQLKDAHAVVTYASNSTLDALMAGVPVFVMGPNIAKPLSGVLETIETPVYPDREEFFRFMAYCQFNCLEFQSGFARKTADENYD